MWSASLLLPKTSIKSTELIMSTATIGYGQPNRGGGGGREPYRQSGQSRSAQPAGIPGLLTIIASRNALWAPSVTLQTYGTDGRYHAFEGSVQHEQNLEVGRLLQQTRNRMVVQVNVSIVRTSIGDMAFVNSIGAVIQPDRSRSNSRSGQSPNRLQDGRSRSGSREGRRQSQDRGRA